MSAKEMEKVEKKEAQETEEMTWAGHTFEPDVDILESPTGMTITADLPGVRKEDLEIDLKEGLLTIQGRVGVNEYDGTRALYSEYNVGSFYRRFRLGEVIDQEQIGANLEDGVLTLSLPKKEKAMPRQIPIG